MKQLHFNELGLNETMLAVVDKLYFKTPTNIQQQAIPHILSGKSMVGESQTGSGKTHAYLLPLLQQIDSSKNEVQIVITAPTRELAMQLKIGRASCRERGGSRVGSGSRAKKKRRTYR